MEKFKTEHQTVAYDRDETVLLYSDPGARAGASECSCISCQNFAAQRESAYPEHFVALLETLGIDPRKELEAFDYDFDLASDRHLYGGWFAFCGRLVEGTNWRPEQQGGEFTYWFTSNFPKPQANPDLPLCAVEFIMSVAWVLPKPH